MSAFTPLLARAPGKATPRRRLDLRLALGSITESASRAYVLGMFSDVTPTGAAQAVDARLGGAIAEFTRRRMFSANVGEVFIVPTGAHELRAEIVLFAGLGPFDRFNEEVLELVAENVVRTLVASGLDDFSTVLIGGGSGQSVARVLPSLLRGFRAGLLDADPDRNFRRVTICEMDPAQFRAMQKELARLARTNLLDGLDVAFEERELPVAPPTPAPPQGLVTTPRAPVYLIVREGPAAPGLTEFHTSALTAGSKAAIVAGRKSCSLTEIETFLAGLPNIGFAPLQRFGTDLAQKVLAAEVIEVLPALQSHHLVIVNDAGSSRLPWETLRFGSHVPAVAAGVSRRYMAENLSVAKWLEERRRRETLDLLLVVNPTGDLDGAEAEGGRIRELFGAHPGVHIVERRGAKATRATLLRDFRSGAFDVIHYAGHAFFDPAHVSRSGLVCHRQEVLSGADLAGLGRLPGLVFFNACEAGRVRGGAAPAVTTNPVARNVGLAEAFLRGGAANYVGTYWPVGDASASRFAETFYARLMQGGSMGSAVLAGRLAVEKLRSIDWADYIHYGDPEFALKLK
jgi:hypothetical protein